MAKHRAISTRGNVDVKHARALMFAHWWNAARQPESGMACASSPRVQLIWPHSGHKNPQAPSVFFAGRARMSHP